MKIEIPIKILLATTLAATFAVACSDDDDDDDDTTTANDDDVTPNDDDDITDDDDMTDDDDATDDDDDDTADPCGDGYCLDGEDCDSCPADCGDCADPSRGCADGTTEQTFSATMVGCSASALWRDSNSLCGPGWSICTGADWVARHGDALPSFQYWTANLLKYDGNDGECSVSLDSGYSCGGYDAMLVCADYEDALGNQCNWIGCGLDDASANDSFGGCNNESGAGAICCVDPTPPATGDDLCDVRELGNAEECPPACGDGVCNEDENCGNCSSDCGNCCGNGTCDEGLENCLTCPEDCDAEHCDPICGDDQCDAPGESCYNCSSDCGNCCGNGVCDAETENCATCPSDCATCCGDGVCGDNDSCSNCPADCGACANPASPCADNSVEDTFTGNMAGCAGQVNWTFADALCGPSYTACTAQQWMDNFGSTAPTHNYWTKDYLNYSGGGSDNCFVSTDVGNSCGDLTPMRVCVDGGTDPEGNHCNWFNCGYGVNEPQLYFGGCSGNMTAGTLCCPK